MGRSRIAATGASCRRWWSQPVDEEGRVLVQLERLRPGHRQPRECGARRPDRRRASLRRSTWPPATTTRRGSWNVAEEADYHRSWEQDSAGDGDRRRRIGRREDGERKRVGRLGFGGFSLWFWFSTCLDGLEARRRLRSFSFNFGSKIFRISGGWE